MVGQIELETGDLGRAIASLEKSRRADPQFAPPYLALAAAYSKLGQFDRVAENLTAYLHRNPGHYVTHLYLAECYLHLADDDLARLHYLAFATQAEQDPDNHRERLLHAYQRLATLAERLGDPFETELFGAIVLVHECQRLNRVAPVNAAATAFSMDALARNEMLALAAQRLESARSARPGDLRVRTYLSIVDRAQNEAKAAQRQRLTASE